MNGGREREREVYSPSGSHSESNSKRQESVRTTVNWCLGPGTDQVSDDSQSIQEKSFGLTAG